MREPAQAAKRSVALAAALCATMWTTGPAQASETRATCARIAAEAEAAGLPAAYLARLLWTESRFDAGAVSPKGALGVAQFMPDTAARRGLADPFDPAAAIAASARYLADLRRRFGNLGLAAAAYNAGEARVAGWLERGGRLPQETEAYVVAVAGMPADWFRRRNREAPRRPLDSGRPFLDACAALPRAAQGGWRVALAVNLDQAEALRMRDRLNTTYGPLFEPHRLIAERNPQRRRGAWAVTVATPRWSLAVSLCERLRARGGACQVFGR